MKISELFQPLLEYSRDITLQKMAKQLQTISDTTKLEPASVLEQLENIDPTKNKQYVPWLVKQLAANQFRLEDRHRINNLLTDFLSIKNRLPQEQRDLGKLSLHQLDDIVDKAMNVELATDKEETTDTGAGTFPVVPGSKVLYNGPLGQLAIPETEEASYALGSGTKWCTAARNHNMFDVYNDESPLYIWRDKNGEKYQFFFGAETSFRDSSDRYLDNASLAYFRTKHPIISKLFKREMDRELHTAEMAWQDAKTTDAPARDSKFQAAVSRLFGYAEDVLRGRWPDAEQYIQRLPGAWEDYTVVFNVK